MRTKKDKLLKAMQNEVEFLASIGCHVAATQLAMATMVIGDASAERIWKDLERG